MVKQRLHKGDDHDDIHIIECPACDHEVYFDPHADACPCSNCGGALAGLGSDSITVADAIEREQGAHLK